MDDKRNQNVQKGILNRDKEVEIMTGYFNTGGHMRNRVTLNRLGEICGNCSKPKSYQFDRTLHLNASGYIHMSFFWATP